MPILNSANQTITEYNVQTGTANNTLNQVPPSTSGYVLTSNGATSQPSFQAVSASGALTNFTVDAETETGSTTVTPDNGNIIVSADIVTQQAIPIRTQSPALHQYNVEVQYCDSNDGAMEDKSGMSHFNSTQFTVDNTTGYVSLSSSIPAVSSGTFTPVLSFGGATTGITYSIQNGVYTQIGPVVFYNFAMTLSSAGSATGTALINGLPLPVSQHIDGVFNISYANIPSGTESIYTILYGVVTDQLDPVYVNTGSPSNTGTPLDNTFFIAATQMRGWGYYITS
jgi:hypothetical protein